MEYGKQVHTYLKGTLLRLFNYHKQKEDLKDAEYVRSVIKEDLKKRYEIEEGKVKIKKA